MNDEQQKVGDLLDTRGLTLELNNGDMLTDAVLIAKVITEDGGVRVALGNTEGISWLEQLGLVTAANGIVSGDGFTSVDDDE